MPIQFLCPECGKWLQVSVDHIGDTARCPECGHQSTIPEESDRPIAEGECFYCGAPLKASSQEMSQGEELPACKECRVSMETNAKELAQERAEAGRSKRLVVRICLAMFAAYLVYWLLSSLHHWLAAADTATFRPTCAIAGEQSAPTAGLPAPGALARAE